MPSVVMFWPLARVLGNCRDHLPLSFKNHSLPYKKTTGEAACLRSNRRGMTIWMFCSSWLLIHGHQRTYRHQRTNIHLTAAGRRCSVYEAQGGDESPNF